MLRLKLPVPHVDQQGGAAGEGGGTSAMMGEQLAGGFKARWLVEFEGPHSAALSVKRGDGAARSSHAIERDGPRKPAV